MKYKIKRAQREKSNIFFSLLTWTPPETPGVSKDGPSSKKILERDFDFLTNYTKEAKL